MVFGVNKIKPLVLVAEEEDKVKYNLKDHNIRDILYKEFDSKYPHVFVDFKETIEAVRNRLTTVHRIKFVSVKSVIYGFDRKFLESLIERKDKNYSILLSIIWRIHNAYTIIENTKTEQKGVIFRLQLFIDTHLELCNYMITYQKYTDSELEDISQNEETLGESVLKSFYPSDYNFYYCGDLPDLSPIVDAGNIWYDVKRKIENILFANIHFFSSKTQYHKCQVRNFSRILYNYMLDYPVFFKLLKLYCLISLLGNYSFCSYRPDFTSRLTIIHSFKNIDQTKFYQWMYEQESFIYFATREYYYYVCKIQYSLDFFMENTSNWSLIKNSIINTMDVCRSILSRYLPNIQLAYSEIEKHIESVHQNNLNYITKLRKSTFLNLVVSQAATAAEKNIQSKTTTESQSSERFISKELRIVIDNVCHYLSQKNEIKGKLPFKWLKVFGVTKEGFDLIRNLYYLYERKDIADNSIPKKLSVIYQNNSNDFHIIRYYLQKLKTLISFESYLTCFDKAQNQIEAHRRKWICHPWDEFDERLADYYYCENCKKWAHPVVDGTGQKSQMNIYATGLEKALYNYEDNKLYCGKQNVSLAVNKLKTSGLYYADDVSDLKVAKVIRKQKENKKCSSIPLVEVNMIGRIQEIDDKKYALCEVCSGLIEYEGNKFNARGFTCNVHNQSFFQKIVAPKIEFTVPNEADPLYKQRLEKGIIPKRTKDRCIYCGLDNHQVLLLQQQSLINAKILNDENKSENMKYEVIQICNSDFSSSAFLFENGGIPQKSILLTTIKTNREKYLSRNINIMVQ